VQWFQFISAPLELEPLPKTLVNHASWWVLWATCEVSVICWFFHGRVIIPTPWRDKGFKNAYHCYCRYWMLSCVICMYVYVYVCMHMCRRCLSSWYTLQSATSPACWSVWSATPLTSSHSVHSTKLNHSRLSTVPRPVTMSSRVILPLAPCSYKHDLLHVDR